MKPNKKKSQDEFVGLVFNLILYGLFLWGIASIFGRGMAIGIGVLLFLGRLAML